MIFIKFTQRKFTDPFKVFDLVIVNGLAHEIVEVNRGKDGIYSVSLEVISSEDKTLRIVD